MSPASLTEFLITCSLIAHLPSLPAGQYNEQLMNAIAAEATPRIQEFSQQNLSNLCWAFGKLGHFDRELMAAIAERSIVLIKVLH